MNLLASPIRLYKRVSSRAASAIIFSNNFCVVATSTPAYGPAKVHSFASVHPNAEIGEGVTIAEYCTLGANVKVGHGCQLRPGSHVFGNTQLGDGCVLMTGAVVGDELPGSTVIGRNNIFGHHSVIGVKCQDLKYKEGDECFLRIGDGNEIREFCSIHRSANSRDVTIIGNNNLIMGSCHIAHDCSIGNYNIIANNTMLAGHVHIEDFVRTAGAVVVHQFCRIGSYSFVGGGSVVSQDVPTYTMVSGERAELRGLNLEGLRRCGFSAAEITSLKAVYRKIFMAGNTSMSFEERLHDVEKNMDLGNSPFLGALLQSIRHSFGENRRGICKFRSFNNV